MSCRLLDGHEHRWNGPPLGEWVDCAACDGTGVDADADPSLNDVRFPDCLECGGDGGEFRETCETCSTCGASAMDVAMLEAS